MASDKPIVEQPLNPEKRVIVIGASTGFGAALAREAAARGFHVALVSRQLEALEKLAAEITEEHGVRAFAYQHDVKATDQVPALLQRILQDLGGLEVFIYNAGIMYQQGVDRYLVEEDLETIEVNLKGAAAWLLPVAQRFERAGSGHLVGVGSVAGERGRAGLPAYSASKAGLHTYLEGLRNRLARHGVVVTTIKPGQMETTMLERAAKIRGPIPVDRAARQAWQAILSGAQIAFIPKRWSLIALVVRNIPSFIFRRLSI